jgi:hypothetical protein
MKACLSGRSFNSLTWVWLALIAICIAKMASLSMMTPIVGYANNYDFIRESSCIGLWNIYGSADKLNSQHPEGPVRKLIFDGKAELDYCMPSADVLFPWLVTLFHHKDDVVDFREVSAFRILAVISALIVLLISCESGGQRIVVAGIFLLLFGDLAYLCYFNTLYSEFSVLLGLVICVVMAWRFWIAQRPPTVFDLGIAFIGIAFLGLSKEQYVPLAVIFAALFAATTALLWRTYIGAGLLVVAAIFAMMLFHAGNARETPYRIAMVMANKTDTFLDAVLPAAANRREALTVLGLPDSCARGIGQSWYTPGIMEHHPCPEVRHASRLRLIKLFLLQPATFFRPIVRGIDHLRPILFKQRLGIFENPQAGRSNIFRSTQLTSLSTFLDAISDRFFNSIIYVAIALGFASAIYVSVALGLASTQRVFMWRLDAKSLNGGVFLLGIAGSTIFYAVAASVFGDGMNELNKHATVVAFSVGLGILAVLIMICSLLFSLRTKQINVAADKSPSYHSRESRV